MTFYSPGRTIGSTAGGSSFPSTIGAFQLEHFAPIEDFLGILASRRPSHVQAQSADPDILSVFLHLRQVQPSGGESLDTYLFAEIASDTDAARAFSLTKSDGTVYHTEVTTCTRSCDCKGHLRHGHCKHADAIAALMEAGRLDAPVCHDVAA